MNFNKTYNNPYFTAVSVGKPNIESILRNSDILNPSWTKLMNPKNSGQVCSHLQVDTISLNHEGKDGEKKIGNDWDHFENHGAAFLGPQLWEKTVPCDTDLKLEYMDLDDFLNEKNIDDELLKRTIAALPPIPPAEKSTGTPEPPADLTQLATTLASENSVSSSSPCSSKTGCSSPANNRIALDYSCSPRSDPKSPLSPASSVSDEDFDPRNHPFSEDELKPQPMSKKSQKKYVPHDLKDDRYWARRRKNNMAAKRSRDARRMKENQIAIRACFLEKENNNLRSELDKTRTMLEMMKKRLEVYEPSE